VYDEELLCNEAMGNEELAYRGHMNEE